MSRYSAAIFALILGAGATAACAPTIGRHGFQAVEAEPADVVAGTDTRDTVRTRLGSPSATSTFEDNIWYYISQTSERYTYNRPQIAQRSITAISFDETSGVVTEVRTLGLEDGQEVAMNNRETPTRGRELSVIEQLLGNVGRGQLNQNEDIGPGQRRPD